MYKERLDVGAKSQFTSPFHQSDLVICSFVLLFVGFCLCFIRQLISPVSLKQESIRFRPAFMLRVSPPHSAMWLISTMNLGPVPTAVPVYPHDAADINTNTDVHVNTVTRVMLFSNELQYLQYGRAESQNPQSRPEIDFLCSCLVFTNKQTNAFLLVGFLVFRGCVWVCGCVFITHTVRPLFSLVEGSCHKQQRLLCHSDFSTQLFWPFFFLRRHRLLLRLCF